MSDEVDVPIYEGSTDLFSEIDQDMEKLTTLRAIADLEPQIADVHIALGEMLLSQGKIDEAEKSLAHAFWLDPYHDGVQEVLEQIQMRRTGGGSVMTVLVRDRAEQLPALVSQASMVQYTLLREFREIEGVEVSLEREIGTTDQTRYVVTGITLTAYGVRLEGLNGRLEEWMEVNNVNECGNVRLQVTESALTMRINTLRSEEEVRE